MPRMEAESTDRSPEKGDPASRLTFGVRLPRAWMSVTPLDRSVSVVTAVMAIGTFWMFSSRRSAVTRETRYHLPVLPAGRRNIEILLDRVRMLAHQRFHARALAALQGRYDAVMLTMCISHRVVHPLEARLVEGERLRAREGNACVALQSLLDDGTVALAHDELVEADVHVDIQRFEFVRDVRSEEHT